MYDLIGDIHGYAEPLRRLLHRLDYREQNGIWQHPERKVIFLGDFVDRGPDQVETVRIARRMVESGHALAVMGNHEFNAVAWATEHPDQSRSYLRPHNSKNRQQHQAFLDQVVEGSALHQEFLAWFKTLPLFLDLDGLRVVHACWHRPSLDVLAEHTDGNNCILPTSWAPLSAKGTAPYAAVETILKGLEVTLPAGHGFVDKDGHARNAIRTQWWDLEGITYRDLAMVPPDVIESIPHEPIPQDVLPGYDGEKPLFIGHYWMTGEPAPLNRFIACLDYSIAAKRSGASKDKGKLCAYRWDGETELLAERFVWVS